MVVESTRLQSMHRDSWVLTSVSVSEPTTSSASSLHIGAAETFTSALEWTGIGTWSTNDRVRPAGAELANRNRIPRGGCSDLPADRTFGAEWTIRTYWQLRVGSRRPHGKRMVCVEICFW